MNYEPGRSSQNMNLTVPCVYPKKVSERQYPIGLDALLQYQDKDPSIIARNLLKPKSGYEILLADESIQPKKMDAVLKALELAVSCRTDEEATRDLLLITFRTSTFKMHLSCYISELKYADEGKVIEYLPGIIKIIERYTLLIPIEACTKIMGLDDSCKIVLNHFKNENSSNFNVPDLEARLSTIESQLSYSRKLLHENYHKAKKDAKFGRLNKQQPPDKFRRHQIFPTCNELLESRAPFLRRIIVDGPYEDSEHYLDIQFRLMKEDFVRPLREGLQIHQKNTADRNCDVRVYTGVKFVRNVIEQKGLIFYVSLNLPKSFDPDKSKRFMFGNILCLSCNEFKTMAVAEVANRDKLTMALLGIQFGDLDKFNISREKTYTILESKAFFTAYKHTLAALQIMNRVPLESILIKVTEDSKHPEYVQKFTCFKFCTHNHNEKYSLDQKVVVHDDIISESTEHCIYTISGENEAMPCTMNSVCLLDSLDNWPSNVELKLDESQRQALHGALTRRVSIIQGPPGTGKTYLGLKIAEILLRNKKHWNNCNDLNSKSPILVVCFTNHALDQFLEGITQFTTSLIRVGSRSQNESLKPYEINAFMNQAYRKEEIGYTISSGYGKVLHEIDCLKDSISKQSGYLSFIDTKGIISLSTFVTHGIVSSELASQINMYMGDFLIRNCVSQSMKACFFQSKLPAAKVNTTEHFRPLSKITDRYEEIDKTIFQEEQNYRILDEEVQLQAHLKPVEEGRNTKNDFSINHDLTLEGHWQAIENCHERIKSSDNKNCTNLGFQLEVLQKEIDALEGLTYFGNEDQCKGFEKVSNIHSLNHPNRWKLYNYWKKQLRNTVLEKKIRLEKTFVKKYKDMESLKSLEYLSAMKNVDVVGMTTTGAAQHCNILHDLGPPIGE